MQLNQQYQIEIFDISTSGEGIGRVEGVVTFVPGLVPGDVATVEITEVKKNLAKGKIVSIDEPSADRCEAPCPYFEKCGGCTLQNMTYDAQLRLKDKQLKDKLDRIYGGDAPAYRQAYARRSCRVASQSYRGCDIYRQLIYGYA